jgi:hypothetical protein
MAIPSTYPSDGRITSLANYTAALIGAELFPVVAPGNAASGVNYNITANQLAQSLARLAGTTVFVLAGATQANPYLVPISAGVVLFNKTVGTASWAQLPQASLMQYGQSVFFKDFKGDAATNEISVIFSNSETCDSQTTMIINAPYGWITLSPTLGGGSWYQSS